MSRHQVWVVTVFLAVAATLFPGLAAGEPAELQRVGDEYIPPETAEWTIPEPADDSVGGDYVVPDTAPTTESGPEEVGDEEVPESSVEKRLEVLPVSGPVRVLPAEPPESPPGPKGDPGSQGPPGPRGKPGTARTVVQPAPHPPVVRGHHLPAGHEPVYQEVKDWNPASVSFVEARDGQEATKRQQADEALQAQVDELKERKADKTLLWLAVGFVIVFVAGGCTYLAAFNH